MLYRTASVKSVSPRGRQRSTRATSPQNQDRSQQALIENQWQSIADGSPIQRYTDESAKNSKAEKNQAMPQKEIRLVISGKATSRNGQSTSTESVVQRMKRRGNAAPELDEIINAGAAPLAEAAHMHNPPAGPAGGGAVAAIINAGAAPLAEAAHMHDPPAGPAGGGAVAAIINAGAAPLAEAAHMHDPPAGPAAAAHHAPPAGPVERVDPIEPAPPIAPLVRRRRHEEGEADEPHPTRHPPVVPHAPAFQAPYVRRTIPAPRPGEAETDRQQGQVRFAEPPDRMSEPPVDQRWMDLMHRDAHLAARGEQRDERTERRLGPDGMGQWEAPRRWTPIRMPLGTAPARERVPRPAEIGPDGTAISRKELKELRLGGAELREEEFQSILDSVGPIGTSDPPAVEQLRRAERAGRLDTSADERMRRRFAVGRFAEAGSERLVYEIQLDLDQMELLEAALQRR